LNCLTGQVKGAADYISAENRKSLPLRAANRGDDPLHREVERVAVAPVTLIGAEFHNARIFSTKRWSVPGSNR
jgi:hypothetical protein